MIVTYLQTGLGAVFGTPVMVRLHIVAAVYWAGAAMFLAVVAAPVIDRIRPPSFQRNLARSLWEKAHISMWVAVGVLLFSGVMLFRTRGGPQDLISPEFWKTPLGIKLLLMVAMIVLSLAHDLQLGYGARLVDPKESTEPPNIYGHIIPWVVAAGTATIVVLSVALRS